MDVSERWTRGAGSGVGISSHKNDYRPGVLIHNFVEETAGADMSRTGKHYLGFGEPLNETSTHRASFTPEGKVGEDLMHLSQRHDLNLEKKGLPGDFLTRHGNFAGPRDTFYATINQLTYNEKQLGEPRVDTFLWTGKNQHDQSVPLNATSTRGMDLTTTKRLQWEEEAGASPYSTSTRTALHSASAQQAEHPSKTRSTRPIADSGHLSQVGRRPFGEHSDECDKAYRRIGLRDVYHKP